MEESLASLIIRIIDIEALPKHFFEHVKLPCADKVPHRIWRPRPRLAANANDVITAFRLYSWHAAARTELYILVYFLPLPELTSLATVPSTHLAFETHL
jgi:hypothetical protein